MIFLKKKNKNKIKDKSRNLFKIVSALRSASVERFDVSRMRDFFIYLYVWCKMVQWFLKLKYFPKLFSTVQSNLVNTVDWYDKLVYVVLFINKQTIKCLYSKYIPFINQICSCLYEFYYITNKL